MLVKCYLCSHEWYGEEAGGCMTMKDRGSGEASFPGMMPPLFCFFAGALFGTSGIAQVNRRNWLQLAHRPLATAFRAAQARAVAGAAGKLDIHAAPRHL